MKKKGKVGGEREDRLACRAGRIEVLASDVTVDAPKLNLPERGAFD